MSVKGARVGNRKQASSSRYRRRLQLERLEDRRMLALVGVDFGPPTDTAPNNWTHAALGATPAVFQNLIDETGSATAIDLTVNAGGNLAGLLDFAIAPQLVPDHTQSLAKIDGVTGNGVRLTFQFDELEAGKKYDLFVFAGDPFGTRQVVTMQGEGAPVVFSQTPAGGQLFVNRQLGSNASLDTFAEVVTADASGRIVITVEEEAGPFAAIAPALAIRRSTAAPPPPVAEVEERLYAIRGLDGSLPRIEQIDPVSGAVLRSFPAPAVPQQTGPQGLAVGPDSLFYIDGSAPGAHTLYELDRDTGAVLDSDIVDAGQPRPFAGAAYLNGLVYLEDFVNDQILVWNPETDTSSGVLNIAADIQGGLTGAADLQLLFETNSAGEIITIDPSTGAVLNRQQPGIGGLIGGLAYVRGELWASHGAPAPQVTIHRINVFNGTAVGQLVLTGDEFLSGLGGDGVFQQVSAGEPSLFAVRGLNGQPPIIYTLDSVDGRVLNHFTGPGTITVMGPQGLAFGNGRLFYIDGHGDVPHTLYELDPKTGAVLDSDVVDAASPREIAGATYLDGRVYLERQADDEILVWDPVNDRLVTTLSVAADIRGGLAAAPELGLLYGAGIDGRIVAMHPASGAIVNTVKPADGKFINGLTYHNGTLIASFGAPPVTAKRIDLATGNVLQEFHVGGTGFLSGLAADVTVNVPQPRLFVLNALNFQQAVVELHPITGAEINRFPVPQPISFGSNGLAFDGNSLWILGTSSDLFELNPDTGAVRDADPLNQPAALPSGLAAVGGAIFTVDVIQSKLLKFDPVSDSVVATTDVTGLPNGLRLDGTLAGTPRALYAGVGGQVVEIDPSTGQYRRTVPGVSPNSFGLGVLGGDLYTTTDGGMTLTRFGLDGQLRQTMQLPFLVDAVGADGAASFTAPQTATRPVVDLDGPATAGVNYLTYFTENDPATKIFASSLIVGDASSPTLTGATVTIINPGDGAQEFLEADVSGTSVTKTYSNHTLQLSGEDTLANYAKVLRSVTYRNLKDAFVGGHREVHVTVSTAAATSYVASTALLLNSVNDAPVLTLPGNQTATEGQALVISGLAVSDVDALTAPIKLTLSVSAGTLTVKDNVGQGVPAAGISGNGTSQVVLTGSQSRLRATLADAAGVTFQSGNATGQVTLTATLDDQGEKGSGGAKSVTESLTIDVSAVNDAPVVTVPGDQSAEEDMPLAISGISITDVDAGDSDISVVLDLSGGRLTVKDDVAGGLEASQLVGNDSGQVTLKGPLAKVNTTLSATGGVVFHGDTHSTASVAVTVSADDLGNTGAGGAGQHSRSFQININSVNDGPAVVVPGDQQAVEDQPLAISGISVSDVDAGGADVELKLQVTAGTLSVRSDVSGGLGGSQITGNTSGQVVLTGSPAQINTTLAATGGVTFEGAANASGDSTFTATVDDLGNTGSGGAAQHSSTFNINVAPANDAPVATAPSAVQVDEEKTVKIAGISISDVDAGTANIEVSLEVASGKLVVKDDVSGGLNAQQITGNGTMRVVLVGTLAEINATLDHADGVAFTGAADSTGDVTLDVAADDRGNTGAGGAAQDSASTQITINPVNDAPRIVLPAKLEVDEDEPLAITGIFVADVDAASADIQVTLEVAAGSLTLKEDVAGGVTAQQLTGNGTSRVVLTGSLSAINATLADAGGLFFQAVADANGQVALSATVDDLGNSGAGGAAQHSASTQITINPVNDGPVVTVPSSLSTQEDVPLVVSGIAVADVDAANSSIEVILQASAGTILVKEVQNNQSPQITGNGSGEVKLAGTLDAINSLLDDPEGVVFQGELNSSGQVTLTVTADDLGNSGAGAAAQHSGVIGIDIVAVNDAPVLSLPGNQQILEDQALVLSGVGVTDVDAQDQTIQLTLHVTAGTLTISNTVSGGIVSGQITGNGTTQLVLLASQSQINTTLADANGLVFQGNPEASGRVTLTATADDRGFSGGGGAVQSTGSLHIDITGVNDVPSLALPGAMQVDEDQTLSLTGIQIQDADAGNELVQVTLTVQIGTLTLSTDAPGGLVAADVQGNGTSAVVITAPLDRLNATLAANDGLRYRNQAPRVGNDQLSISAKDGEGATSNGAVPVEVRNLYPYFNRDVALDADNDGKILPVDALLVLNWINSGKPSKLPPPTSAPTVFLDASRDGFVTAVDALMMFNHLNTQPAGEPAGGTTDEQAEGEPHGRVGPALPLSWPSALPAKDVVSAREHHPVVQRPVVQRPVVQRPVVQRPVVQRPLEVGIGDTLHEHYTTTSDASTSVASPKRLLPSYSRSESLEELFEQLAVDVARTQGDGMTR